MITKHMKCLLAGSAVALSGCTTPSDQTALDAREIKGTYYVKGKADDMFYQLATQAPPGSICSEIISTQSFLNKGHFRVYYGPTLALFGKRAVNTGIYGTQEGEQIRIDYREFGGHLVDPPYPNAVRRFLETGDCGN